MINKNKKIFVAMSGGVDSSVAAALLKKSCFNVVGVFMKPYQPKVGIFSKDNCLWRQDREDALRVAAKLDIPLLTWDLSKEYEKYVAKYMIEGYRKGITPNPDIMCNKFIKFGVFLEKALALGADYIVTGHYVRLKVGAPRGSNSARSFSGIPAMPSDSDSATSRKRLGGTFDEKVVCRFVPLRGNQAKTASESARRTTPTRLARYKLLKAMDSNKDQSYFLYTLTQEQLKYCLFPIGDYMKSEVRKMARKFGLPNWNKKDSVGVCFVGPLEVKEFLKRSIQLKKGLVLRKSDGKILGEHDGAWFYTIGQRHGMGLNAGSPYYVVDKDTKNNIIFVGHEIKRQKSELQISDFNWINKSNSLPLDCKVKTRYRQRDLNCVILKNGSGKILVKIKKNNLAIAPGQSAVFYKGKEVLGGGIITLLFNESPRN